ncbi:hypothetical protein [Deinococcus sp. UYEF24]
MVRDQTDPALRRPSLWDVARWIAVLPAAVIIYTLVPALLVPLFDALPHLPGTLGYTLIFALSALAAVFTGAFVAPAHRVWTAGVLTLVLAGVLTFFALALQVSGVEAASLRQSVLFQIIAALLVVYTLWRADRRAAKAYR